MSIKRSSRPSLDSAGLLGSAVSLLAWLPNRPSARHLTQEPSHNLTVRSADVVTMSFFAEISTERIPSVCPERSAIFSPVAPSQSSPKAFQATTANNRLSGEKAASAAMLNPEIFAKALGDFES